MTGTRGKNDYLYVRIIEDEHTYLNQRVGRISNNTNANNKYLYYFLKSNSFRDSVFEYETGTVNQGNISSKDIMNQEIPKIPIQMQNSLTSYLDNLSAQISQIKSAQQQKMQSLLDLKSSILDQAFHGMI